MTNQTTLSTEVLSSVERSHEEMRKSLAWAEYIDFSYAWMTSRKSSFELWRVLDQTKIRRGVLGLNFARTEPSVLQFFLDTVPETVRVIEDKGSVFHPKLLVATKGNERRAILGSSNFTQEGFSSNTEINVLLAGHVNDRVFQDLDAAILAHWLRAELLTGERIASYRAHYKVTRRLPETPRASTLARSAARRAARRVVTIEDLNVPWPEYAELLQRQLEAWAVEEECRKDEIPFLTEIQEIQRLLEDNEFEDLKIDDRRRVAGFKVGYGWLGASRSNRTFMGLVKDEAKEVGRILKPIPFEERVTNKMIRKAFGEAEGLPWVRMASVTRLLCVKRPDYFITVNRGNRRLMRQVLGVLPGQLDVDGYLALLRRIQALPWWDPGAGPMADPLQAWMWRARVALLDTFFYEPA